MIIKPTNKQIEAAKIADKSFITLYGGAIRGGKSYWLLLLIWTYSLKYPKSRWCIIRKTHAVLISTILVSLKTLLDKGLSNDIENFNNTTLTITLKNGSQIIFMAESYEQDKELNRFRGLEVNGFGIDEINEIQEETLYKCIERAGSWQHSLNCPQKIIATCNPTMGWVKEKFYDNYINGTLPKNWAYVPAKITDNPYVDKNYIESLKALPFYQYQCYVEGRWDLHPTNGGELFKQFNYDRHTKDNINYNSELALHISFDFNTNPRNTCIITQIEGKKIRIIDELGLTSPNNSTAKVSKEIIRKYGTHQGGLFVYGDPSGKAKSTLHEEGINNFTIIMKELAIMKPSLRLLTKAPSIVMRTNFINTIFEDNFEEIEILINRECKYLIEDFLYLKEAEDGTKSLEYMKTDSGVRCEKYGHASDALIYLICHAFNTQYELYQRGSKPFSNMKLGIKSISRNGY